MTTTPRAEAEVHRELLERRAALQVTLDATIADLCEHDGRLAGAKHRLALAESKFTAAATLRALGYPVAPAFEHVYEECTRALVCAREAMRVTTETHVNLTHAHLSANVELQDIDDELNRMRWAPGP